MASPFHTKPCHFPAGHEYLFIGGPRHKQRYKFAETKPQLRIEIEGDEHTYMLRCWRGGHGPVPIYFHSSIDAESWICDETNEMHLRSSIFLAHNKGARRKTGLFDRLKDF